jgi:hypothetical protein
MRACAHRAQIAAAVGATRVYSYGEVTAEERAAEAAVARGLDAQGAKLEVRAAAIHGAPLAACAPPRCLQVPSTHAGCPAPDRPARAPARQVVGVATLLHLEDVPFTLSAMPMAYGDFAALVKGKRGGALGRGTPVRRPLPAPETLKGLPAGRWGCQRAGAAAARCCANTSTPARVAPGAALPRRLAALRRPCDSARCGAPT